MEITWHGNSCVSIKSNDATAVINPYKDGKGFKLPDLKADVCIVTNTQEGNDNAEALKGEPKLIDWPGEYEVSGIVLNAMRSPETKGFFITLVADNLRICYLENVGKKLEEDMVDKIGDIDILILPVGGKEEMDAKTAHEIAETIEPRCIIPMNFDVDGSTAGLSSPDEFLKLVGAAGVASLDQYKISSRSSLKDDKTECVLLEPQVG